MHVGLPTIPGTPQEDFDFFLAHADEVAALTPDGILLATIGGTDTWLLQLWRSC
jgi:hypothetical protein